MTRSLSLELQKLVQEELTMGRYASEDELLLDAVRLLSERNRRREQIRRELQSGREQLDRGEGIVLKDDDALMGFLDEIEAEVRTELAAKKQSQ